MFQVFIDRLGLPASQPTSQAASQQASKPARQPAQSASQPSSQQAKPASKPASKPARRPTSQPASQSASQQASQPASKPASQPASYFQLAKPGALYSGSRTQAFRTCSHGLGQHGPLYRRLAWARGPGLRARGQDSSRSASPHTPQKSFRWTC